MEFKGNVLDDTQMFTRDFLRTNLPSYIHNFNHRCDPECQIIRWENSVETTPHVIMTFVDNWFLVEIGENNHFRFTFIHSDLNTLIAVTLRRLGLIPPFSQISCSRKPLIELMVRVTL